MKPFVTPSFDGSTVSVTSLLVDRDGNLWVATGGRGSFASMATQSITTDVRKGFRRFR